VATLTKAELRDRVLEHMGILAAGQSASSEDAVLVEEAIDSAHAQLRKFGLAPFATSAIPAWAQPMLRDYVAGIVGPSFGFGALYEAAKDEAEKDLSRQLSSGVQPLAVKAEYY
jgi:hypothetical protein